MRDKTAIEEKRRWLIEATTAYCREQLNEEYRELCEKLIDKMSRKRAVPFLSGQLDIWAAAVVYAIGQINFLFDKSFEPYVTADDIRNHFGVKNNTVTNKAKYIRDMFKMGYYDEEFSTEHVEQRNPFRSLVTIDEMIVPKSMLPPEIQKTLTYALKSTESGEPTY